MSAVSFRAASRTHPGADAPAVDALDLEVADGEFLVLVGPSGSGKSTALRMLAGLEEVDGGSVHIGDTDVTRIPPRDRDIAMVFQSYALYPHMTVAQNMGFALRLAGVGRDRIRDRVAHAAGLLDLTALLDRRPHALSGGQRQRVAMGRAMVREPAVFLLDEPLSNLDAKLRVETRANIAALQRRLGTTMLYVTHDQVEAMTMGDRVAVLRDGVLQQCDTPQALYHRPVNAFVAGFVGSPAMNLVRMPLTAAGAALGSVDVPVPRDLPAADGEVLVGVRPEALTAVAATEPGLDVTVDLVEELGADAYVHGSADGQRVCVRTRSPRAPAPGSVLRVAPTSPDDVHVFDATGARVS